MTGDRQGGGRAHVLAVLSQHGLTPSPEELDVLIAAYPVYRMLAAASYSVPDVRYAEPATTFALAGMDSSSVPPPEAESREGDGR